jgi:hypothetical protein
MKFTAVIDKKYTVWQRLDIEFEAANQQEANELLEKWDGLPPDSEYDNTESLYDTEEAMTVGDNGGEPVYEVKVKPDSDE